MSETIAVPELVAKEAFINIVGDSPLITHRHAPTLIQDLIDRQNGIRAQKRKRDPEKECEDAKYPLPDGSGYGIPAVAFKKATVSAARYIHDLPMTQVHQKVLVFAPPNMRGYLPLEYSSCVRREDLVRLNKGGLDVRFRPQFNDWSVRLHVRYIDIALETVVTLLDLAGKGVGVGDWRPECDGIFGTFHVK